MHIVWRLGIPILSSTSAVLFYQGYIMLKTKKIIVRMKVDQQMLACSFSEVLSSNYKWRLCRNQLDSEEFCAIFCESDEYIFESNHFRRKVVMTIVLLDNTSWNFIPLRPLLVLNYILSVQLKCRLGCCAHKFSALKFPLFTMILFSSIIYFLTSYRHNIYTTKHRSCTYMEYQIITLYSLEIYI